MLHLMVYRGLFPSYPTKKMAEPNLVILVIFLVALGPEGGGLWGDKWVMRHPRTIQKDFTFDDFKMAYPLFTHD